MSYYDDNNDGYVPYGNEQVIIRDERPRRGVSGGALAILLVFTIVISTVLGALGGAYLADKLPGTGNSPGGTTIYKIEMESGASKDSGYEIWQIAAAVADSVVEISTEAVTIGGGWNKDYQESGAGSGVIISTDGYIITCAHVIDDATKVYVVFTDGTRRQASIIGYDSKSDIGVLKIDPKGLTLNAAVFANSDETVVGERVIAVGNPLGDLGGTITDGIVSALNREITVEGYDMVLLQTNASVSPGNSGGGLFNSYGHLIGIVNAKSTATDVEGIGFAIPSNIAMEIATGLIDGTFDTTERAALGVVVVELLEDEALAEYGKTIPGVYVASVNNKSAADIAGLLAGDRIISVDDVEVTNNDDLTNYLNGCKVGQNISIVVERNGVFLTLKATLQKYDVNSY